MSSARNVNKHRQVLAAMFQYACREDTHGLEVNPVLAADKRPEPPPAALDYYEFHEVQALADVTAAGDHRHGVRDELDRRIDAQDAESRTVLVRRGLSAGVETIPKGRRYRYVPLATPGRRGGAATDGARGIPRTRRLRLRHRLGAAVGRVGDPPALQAGVLDGRAAAPRSPQRGRQHRRARPTPRTTRRSWLPSNYWRSAGRRSAARPSTGSRDRGITT
jgi:hypothetical protein